MPTSRSLRPTLGALLISLLGWSGLSTSAEAQNAHWPRQVRLGRMLIDHYQTSSLRARALAHLQAQGALAVDLLPPQPIPPRRADLQTMLAQIAYIPPAPEPLVIEPERPAALIERVQVIKKLERSWFERSYADVQWAYIGSNYFTPLDTTRTQVLRARMETHFGPPTRTLAELDADQLRSAREFIQFEYWFVLNDTIPVRIMDVNGPLERGLVFASDQRHRDQLFELRQAFLQDLLNTRPLTPYVDYYYNQVSNAWYRSGYDGERFFLNRIRRPNLTRGRPWLNTANR
ncbi:MAG: hypothetical protein AAGI71_13040 [Bacteroidota bacterium]